MNHWYAFHIFKNYRKTVISKLESDSQQYFVAEQVRYSYDSDYEIETTRKLLFPSIIFVCCSEGYVESLKAENGSWLAPYNTPGTRKPAIISDKEMQTFMFVLDSGCEQIDVIDEKIAKGDKVRVLDGIFKGTEGYIVRIKGDRRFVVSINGVAAVATTYIPKKFLEKINAQETT